MLNSFFAFITGLLKAFIVPFIAYEKGKSDVKLKQAERILSDAEKIKLARADPSYDRQLFKKYRRDK